MADPVDLDPGSHGGTYKLIGGRPALDFANLVSYRATGRQHDWLDPTTNAERWREAAGISAQVEADIAELRQFREVVARAFLAIADGDVPATADVDRIGGLAAGAWAQRQLRFAAGASAATWNDPAPSLITEIALDAASLLTSSEALRRITACGDCRWLFLDTSRNRSRRWCDPSDCGNRARQRRHYRRRRGS